MASQKIWLSHRVEPAWAGQAGRLLPSDSRSFFYGVDVSAPFEERGAEIAEFRAPPSSDPGAKADGQWLMLPARHRASPQLLDRLHPARAIPATSLVREDLPDYTAPVIDSRWRCVGESRLLLAVAFLRSVDLADPPLTDLRFEPRAAIVLESVPLRAAAPYARRLSYVDRQTMRPAYAATFDRKGELLRVALYAWSWSGDDPTGDPSWDGVPAARTLIPYRTLVVNAETGTRKRIDDLAADVRPPTLARIRRTIDGPMIGRQR